VATKEAKLEQEREQVELLNTPAGKEYLRMTPKEQAAELRRVSGLRKALDGRSVAEALGDIATKNLPPPRPWLR
jgi:hypothetical protein